MPLTPDPKLPMCGGCDVTFFMRDGDKLVECLVLPSALSALEAGDMNSDRQRLAVFDRHAALFQRLASAKYDLQWDVPIIGARDL